MRSASTSDWGRSQLLSVTTLMLTGLLLVTVGTCDRYTRGPRPAPRGTSAVIVESSSTRSSTRSPR